MELYEGHPTLLEQQLGPATSATTGITATTCGSGSGSGSCSGSGSSSSSSSSSGAWKSVQALPDFAGKDRFVRLQAV